MVEIYVIDVKKNYMSKKVKIFCMGKRLKDIYPHATKYQVFKYKVRKFAHRCLLLVIVGAILFGIFEAGRYVSPEKVIYTSQEVIKEVPVKAPLLDKIAKCESPNGHFGKNGQVSNYGNKNGTVDIGAYMINSYYWGQTATDMGLNLWVEADNKEFAEWLFSEKGSEPWIATKSCWRK